jgi:hypothetical protein
LRGFGDRLFADLDIHEVLPSGSQYLALSNLPPAIAAILRRAPVFHQAGVRHRRFDRASRACA